VSALKERLVARARELGFARLGVARVEPLGREADALRHWIAEGHHASMAWMAETVDVRIDPSHAGMLPDARSVVVLATPYARTEGPSGPAPGIVARYARGRDYHNVLGKRARKLARLLQDEGHRARVSVDSVPVLERAWAQRAGVGFVGKNCCLIVPGLGSHVLLAALVTDAELPPDEPMPERCGSCRLCLDACPTRAFVAPRELDARRCISYLTIEHRGPIDVELRADLGLHLFGCDDCQDVCPFNRTAPPPPTQTDPFAPDPRLAIELPELLGMDDDRCVAWAHGSPLRRPGREGLARNAAIVLGNSGDRRHLPVLQRAATEDPSETVRDAATWAVERLSSDDSA
jgi:epoxyqueuosine reductase